MIYENKFRNPSKYAPYAVKIRKERELLTDWEKVYVRNSGTFTPKQAKVEVTAQTGAVYFDLSVENEPSETLRLELLTSEVVHQVAIAARQSVFTPLSIIVYDIDTFAIIGDGRSLIRITGYDSYVELATNVTAVAATNDGSGNPAYSQLGYAVCMYQIGDQLLCRDARDDYASEYVMKDGLPTGAKLIAAGVNTDGALQVQLSERVDGAASPPGNARLDNIVTELLRRSNVSAVHIDVDDLSEDYVEGYKVATEAGANANIDPLQLAYFFDVGEWDKKLRFVKRGKAPVMTVTYNELLEAEEPFKTTRVQEIELLRKMNVTYLDSGIGWVTASQSTERRSVTVKAVGESSIVLPLTMRADAAATVATKRLQIPWAEPHKYEFSLGPKWAALTCTDTIVYVDHRGVSTEMRIMQMSEDQGRFELQAASNGRWVYPKLATGVEGPPPIANIPGQIGPTTTYIVNIPALRDQDDFNGYYVGVKGDGKGWRGAEIQFSNDGGASISEKRQAFEQAAFGQTLSGLEPEVSSEYLSTQQMLVTLPTRPESITRQELLRYGNLFAVQHADGSWELAQFQTATEVGNEQYLLTGIVRGRYGTVPARVNGGAPIVPMASGGLSATQMERGGIGADRWVRAVSYGGPTEDEVEWAHYNAQSPAMVTEFAPHAVRAVRASPSNDITATWVGRGRLGVETSPHHSPTNFAGYRVIYSDGYTADVLPTVTTHTRAAAPAGVTIHIAAVNVITGAGPLSEGVTVP